MLSGLTLCKTSPADSVHLSALKFEMMFAFINQTLHVKFCTLHAEQQERLIIWVSATVLTGSNCWPADSKDLLELPSVQKAGGWSCEVGKVSP